VPNTRSKTAKQGLKHWILYYTPYPVGRQRHWSQQSVISSDSGVGPDRQLVGESEGELNSSANPESTVEGVEVVNARDSNTRMASGSDRGGPEGCSSEAVNPFESADT